MIQRGGDVVIQMLSNVAKMILRSTDTNELYIKEPVCYKFET
jgi:hypothetical protein